jgi:CRP/FNR family transcriptional regulator
VDTISRPAAQPFADISANIGTKDFFSTDDGGDAWSDAHANFLSSLSEVEKRDLLKCSSRLDLQPRDLLFRAGDRSNDVYIVAGGCIRLFQISSTGKETILWFSFPGEIFGMAEFCRGCDRQIYAEANEAAQVYSIHRKDFTDFLGAHPEAAMKAIGILSARVRSLGHSLVGLASDNVETRIARLLVRLAVVSSGTRCCIDSTDGELCLNMRLTHQDIANLIGASRQTVTSMLTQLRKRGTIRTVNQHIHILQPDHLRGHLELGAAQGLS